MENIVQRASTLIFLLSAAVCGQQQVIPNLITNNLTVKGPSVLTGALSVTSGGITSTSTGDGVLIAAGNALFGAGILQLKSNGTTQRWDVKSSAANTFIVRDVTAGADRLTIDGSGAVSVPGALTVASCSGCGGVTTFNTRTGAVSLTSGDVSGALGYTPASLGANTFTGAQTVTSGGITSTSTGDGVLIAAGNALFGAGILQLKSNGTTQRWDVKSSVANTFIVRDVTAGVDRLTIDGSGAISVPGVLTVGSCSGCGGGLTSFNSRTGAISLTSGDVTGALGFTPATGTVTSVSGTSPISSSGGTSPALSCSTCVTTGGGQTISGTTTLNTLSVSSGGATVTGGITANSTGDAIITATGSSFGAGIMRLKSNSSSQDWDMKSDVSNHFVVRDVTAGADRLTINSSGAVSMPGALTVGSCSGCGGLTSFNSRTGAISLTSGDVTGALGFTPATGTVTSVSGTSPISSSGGTSPALSCSTCVTTGGGQTISGTTTLNTLSVSSGGATVTGGITANSTGDAIITATGSSFGAGIMRLKSNSSSQDWDMKSDVSNHFVVRDVTAGADRLTINSSGAVSMPGALTVGSCSGCGGNFIAYGPGAKISTSFTGSAGSLSAYTNGIYVYDAAGSYVGMIPII